MHSGVYKIENIQNQKCYIGSSKDIGKRFKEHLFHLNRGTHHSPKLQNSWNKYGEEAFVFKILFICEIKDLLFFEQRTFDNLKPEYNICKFATSCIGVKRSEEFRRRLLGALNPFYGKHHTEESKQKISSTNTGKKLTEESKQKMSDSRRGERNSFYGKSHTEEVRIKMSRSHLGKTLPKEQRKKISESLLDKKHTEESKRKMSEARKLYWLNKKQEKEKDEPSKP